MSLCLETFGQGGSSRNLIFYTWKSNKFQDALSPGQWAKRRPIIHADADASMFGYLQSSYFGVKDEEENIIVRNYTKVLCRFMQDYYYTNSNNNFIVGINLIAVNCSSGSKS